MRRLMHCSQLHLEDGCATPPHILRSPHPSCLSPEALQQDCSETRNSPDHSQCCVSRALPAETFAGHPPSDQHLPVEPATRDAPSHPALDCHHVLAEEDYSDRTDSPQNCRKCNACGQQFPSAKIRALHTGTQLASSCPS